MKLSAGIQRMLPFGYLFLVVMGILKESVFFYQVGINILKYSTVMDILISPIATLTAHPLVFIAVIIVILFSYGFPKLLANQSHKKWAQRMSSIKNSEELSEAEIESHYTNIFIKLFAFTLLSFFLGIGLGGGFGLKNKIMNDKLKYNYKLNYASGESEQIYLISSNSVYYFYLSQGNKSVKIAPIGAVKSLELTNNKMLND